MKRLGKKNPFHKLSTFILLVLLLLISAGCGPKSSSTQTGRTADHVSVDNFDFLGNHRKANIVKHPKKIIVCGGNALDTLIAFGEKDTIHTVVLTEPDSLPKYRQMLPQAEVYPIPISREAALEIKPDFILGMRRFFDNKVLGDTEFWESNGISAYIQDASGPIPSLGNFPPCTVESEKTFLRNMGMIFDKEDFSEAEIKKIDEALDNVPAENGRKPKVLFVEFMPNNIEVFGKGLLSGDIVEKLGGEIISYSTPFISMEELLTVQPDVIFLVHHSGGEQNAVAKIHEEVPANMKAVKENRVYTIPYDRIVSTGIHTLETIQLIRNGIYPDNKS